MFTEWTIAIAVKNVIVQTDYLCQSWISLLYLPPIFGYHASTHTCNACQENGFAKCLLIAWVKIFFQCATVSFVDKVVVDQNDRSGNSAC